MTQKSGKMVYGAKISAAPGSNSWGQKIRTGQLDKRSQARKHKRACQFILSPTMLVSFLVLILYIIWITISVSSSNVLKSLPLFFLPTCSRYMFLPHRVQFLSGEADLFFAPIWQK